MIGGAFAVGLCIYNVCMEVAARFHLLRVRPYPNRACLLHSKAKRSRESDSDACTN